MSRNADDTGWRFCFVLPSSFLIQHFFSCSIMCVSNDNVIISWNKSIGGRQPERNRKKSRKSMIRKNKIPPFTKWKENNQVLTTYELGLSSTSVDQAFVSNENDIACWNDHEAKSSCFVGSPSIFTTHLRKCNQYSSCIRLGRYDDDRNFTSTT